MDCARIRTTELSLIEKSNVARSTCVGKKGLRQDSKVLNNVTAKYLCPSNLALYLQLINFSNVFKQDLLPFTLAKAKLRQLKEK